MIALDLPALAAKRVAPRGGEMACTLKDGAVAIVGEVEIDAA